MPVRAMFKEIEDKKVEEAAVSQTCAEHKATRFCESVDQLVS